MVITVGHGSPWSCSRSREVTATAMKLTDQEEAEYRSSSVIQIRKGKKREPDSPFWKKNKNKNHYRLRVVEAWESLLQRSGCAPLLAYPHPGQVTSDR